MISLRIMNNTNNVFINNLFFSGVVQLFNAVRQQQKEIEEKLVEAGPMERKREKALKNIDRRAFLDVLMGGTSNLAPENKKEELKEEEENDESNNKVSIQCLTIKLFYVFDKFMFI